MSEKPEQALETDQKFKTDLIALIPHLRAFAFSLERASHAEDLAQETVLKAWKARATYHPGTNMKAWLFTILRNHYYSEKRRAWRSQPLEPKFAEDTLVANDDPSACEDLLDVRTAMQLLVPDQREALILVGAAGMSYEDVAHICGCAVGTVKSRVNRARSALAAILERSAKGVRAKSDISSSDVFADIMDQAAAARRRLESVA